MGEKQPQQLNLRVLKIPEQIKEGAQRWLREEGENLTILRETEMAAAKFLKGTFAKFPHLVQTPAFLFSAVNHLSFDAKRNRLSIEIVKAKAKMAGSYVNVQIENKPVEVERIQKGGDYMVSIGGDKEEGEEFVRSDIPKTKRIQEAFLKVQIEKAKNFIALLKPKQQNVLLDMQKEADGKEPSQKFKKKGIENLNRTFSSLNIEGTVYVAQVPTKRGSKKSGRKKTA